CASCSSSRPRPIPSRLPVPVEATTDRDAQGESAPSCSVSSAGFARTIDSWGEASEGGQSPPPSRAMKISYRWLREFVDTDLAPPAIADRLINAGIEVAAVTPVVEGLSGVVVAKIQEIEKDLGTTAAGHHNKLCRVALPDRAVSVICGAPNAVT